MSDNLSQEELDSLRAKLNKYGQGHVLQFWAELSPEERGHLAEDINTVDLAEMTEMWALSQQEGESNTESMVPVEEEMCESLITSSEELLKSYENRALMAMGAGEVGVLLLAGGQGTRLGVSYPKGMYNVGLPSGKSLYQIQVERILRLEQLASRLSGTRGQITMYVMTSEHTKQPTQDYFAENNYFGASSDQIRIFEQRTIPTFDLEGRFLLETKSKLARAPDGNGGLYWALRRQGMLEDIQERGIRYLHVYCVDNILVRVADPYFMGYCIHKKAEAANKVVEKVKPSEAVGVVVKIDSRVQVVEYSEISKEKAEMRDKSGKLTFRAGNICNHFFTTEFLQRVCSKHEKQLPHHIARKKVAHVSLETGQVVKPETPNGIKLEKFVFDVFQFADSCAVWECRREDEFSPLKNGDGASGDTPTTARQALYQLHRKYLSGAGAVVEGDGPVEVSPLVSYGGEELQEFHGVVLACPVHLS